MTGLFLILSVVVCSVVTLSSGASSRQGDINEYYLYTRRNPTSAQLLVVNNANSIRASNFNANRPTAVIVHGWQDDKDSEFDVAVTEAFLEKSDVNVIALDWGTIAKGGYASAVNGVPYVGQYLGQFLDFLNKAIGVPFDRMHLVGSSLGAHVVGNAGRTLDGKIARITGLDPAGPLWYGNPNCLKSSDAQYVEAIHTDSNVVGLGITTAVGDTDFYPNGGGSQPGCSDLFCNHNRCWQLFASSLINNHFVGRRCSNSLQLYSNSCRGSELRMGNDELKKNGSGLYRLETGSTYPY